MMSEDLLKDWLALKTLADQQKFVTKHKLNVKFLNEHVPTDAERAAKLLQSIKEEMEKEEVKDDNSTTTKQD